MDGLARIFGLGGLLAHQVPQEVGHDGLEDGEHLAGPLGAGVIGHHEDAEADALQHADGLGFALVAKVEGRQGLFHAHQLHDVQQVLVVLGQRAQQLVQIFGLDLKTCTKMNVLALILNQYD